MKVAIYGSGELGHQFLNFFTCEKIKVVGFIDDTKKIGEVVKDDFLVIGSGNDLENLFQQGYLQAVAVAIGYKHLLQKQKLLNKIKGQAIPLYTFVHSSAQIDPSATIEEGVVIYPGCLVDKNVTLHVGVILNNGCIISHDTVIGSCSFIAPGVILSGFVEVGERCFLGSGTVTVDNITIVNDTVLGAGALVTKNIVERGTYIGAPIRKIK